MISTDTNQCGLTGGCECGKLRVSQLFLVIPGPFQQEVNAAWMKPHELV